MDLIRSACNSVYVGGLELAVQKPAKETWVRTESGKGTWQDGWEPELKDCRTRRSKKGDIWGTGKDGKEAITVKISANPVRHLGLDNQAVMRGLRRTDRLGQHRKWQGRNTEFSLNRIKNGYGKNLRMTSSSLPPKGRISYTREYNSSVL